MVQHHPVRSHVFRRARHGPLITLGCDHTVPYTWTVLLSSLTVTPLRRIGRLSNQCPAAPQVIALGRRWSHEATPGLSPHPLKHYACSLARPGPSYCADRMELITSGSYCCMQLQLIRVIVEPPWKLRLIIRSNGAAFHEQDLRDWPCPHDMHTRFKDLIQPLAPR